MKKVLFLLAALVVSVSSMWAQGTTSNDNCVADLPTKASAQAYALTTPRGVLIGLSEGTYSEYLQATSIPATSDAHPFSLTDESFQFLLFPVAGQASGYYVYNVGTGKFLGTGTTKNTKDSHTTGVAPLSDTPAVYYIWKHGQTGSKDQGYSGTFNKQDWPFTIGSSVTTSGDTFNTINMTYWNNNLGYDFGTTTSGIDGGNAYAVVPAEEVSDDVYVDAYTKAYGKAPSYVEDQTQGTGTHGELTAADIIGKMTNVGDSYRVVARTVSGTSKDFWLGFTKVAASSDVVDADHILVITKVEGGYTVSTASGKYFGIANGSSGSALCSQEEAGSENIGVVDIVERTSGADTDPYNDGSYKLVSFKLANGNYLNCNNTDATPKWFTGTGGYSLYCIYGIKDAPTSFHYTVNFIGAPEGETPKITVGENQYGEGDEFDSAVLTSDDITASNLEGYISTVTVAGSTITVTYLPTVPSLEDLLVNSVGEKVTTVEEGKWYILTQTRGGETPAYDNNGTVYRASTTNTLATVAAKGTSATSISQYLVRFVDSPITNAKYIQFANGKFWGTTESGNAVIKANETVAGQYLVYEVSGQNGIGINETSNGTTYGRRIDNNAAGNTVAYWDSGQLTGGGNALWYVYPVEIGAPTIDWELYETRLNTLNSYTVGTGLGEYACTIYEQPVTALHMSFYKDAWQETLNEQEEGYYTTHMTEMNEALASMQLNMPQPGTFLRMKGVVNNTNYLLGTKTNDNTKFSMGAAEDATSVFYYDGSHLLSYTTGLYVGTTSSKWQWNLGEGSEINFHDASTKGAYRVQIPKDSGNNPYIFLYSGAANAANADRGGTATLEACTDTRYQWILEEVTELPVAFNENGQGYATLYAPVALEIPEGVEAYTLHEGEDEYLHTNGVETTIPANTAVVLKGTANSTENFAISSEEGTVDNKNVLVGTVAAKVAGADKYVFSIVGGQAGFYKFGGDNLAGFKAYIESNVETQGFVINFGDKTTGINAAQQAQSQKASFDLQGRRISKAVRGLFIQNGQKVIR